MDRYEAVVTLSNRLAFALKDEYVNDPKIKEAINYVADMFKERDKLDKALDMACIELNYLQKKLYECEKLLYSVVYQEYAIPNDLEAKTQEEWKELLLKDET